MAKKKFEIVAKMTITVFTNIEADTLEEAIELAKERTDYMSVVTNSGDSADEVWMLPEELDGMPYDLYEDEV